MSLNPKYITAPSLQMYFVDKDTGEPLAGGKVFFYRDVDKVTPKAVYEIQGVGTNYTYVPLPNPVILSAVGTFADNNGNDVLPYYYPFDAMGAEDLYYIVVQNSNGVPQFVRPAWPNPNESGGIVGSAVVNYIPNGQFLAHTNLPGNALVAGSNIIAQGGWSIELDSGATSVNTLTWITEPYTQDPPQSPRYVGNLVCTSNVGSEVLKNLRCKFNDVNKFTDTGNFTFAIWLQSTFAFNATVEPFYFFGTGGSPSPSMFGTPTVITVTPEGTLFNVIVNFGSNAGDNIGTNNDDYVTVDVSFPTDANINVQFCDAVLLPGSDSTVTAFPTQTNADMITRGIMGWADLPSPTGAQLYLKPMLTRYGMAWDTSEIGKIYGAIYANPQFNELLCDGTSYLTSGYSALEIPYSRLQAVVWNNAVNMPQFGTGYQFINTYVSTAATDTLILVNNSSGSQTATSDSGTTFTFSPGITGSSGYGFNSDPGGNNIVWVSTISIGAPFSTVSAGTSGFTVAIYQNGNAAINQITTLTITALPTAGTYFYMSNTATKQYFWFSIDGSGSDPTPGGTGTQINLLSTFSAVDTQRVIAAALSGYQVSYVKTVAGSAIPANSYFTMYANSLKYVVWYSLNGAGTQPSVASVEEFIPISYTTGNTAAVVATNTQKGSNFLYFGVPDFRETFFRAWSTVGVADSDVLSRYSSNGLNVGNNIGTNEYGQFASHNHTFSPGVTTPGNTFQGGSGYLSITGTTSNTGSSENRPNNSSLNFVIKY